MESFLYTLGYVFAALAWGYLIGTRKNEKEWISLFNRLMTVLEKQGMELEKQDDNWKDIDEGEGEEWKEK